MATHKMATAQADGAAENSTGRDWFVQPTTTGPYNPWTPAPVISPPYVPPIVPYVPPTITVTTTPPLLLTAQKAEAVLLALVAIADREARTVCIGHGDDTTRSYDLVLHEGESFDEFVERAYEALCVIRGRKSI